AQRRHRGFWLGLSSSHHRHPLRAPGAGLCCSPRADCRARRAVGLSPGFLSVVYAHPRPSRRRPLRGTPPLLEDAATAQILHFFPGPGASRCTSLAPVSPRRDRPAPRSRLDRSRSRGNLGCRPCRRGHRRRPAPRLQIESGSQRKNVPRGPLELFPPSQLFLRVAGLARLCALRARLSPALMLFFLFRVTGIPATEAQALRSRGEDYRRYQETTSAFVPWFPKKRPAA